jgi:hypothetical protein
MQPEAERVGEKRAVCAECLKDCPAAKQVHHTASKIHGVAPKRKPRIGPDYQIPIIPVPATEQVQELDPQQGRVS